MARTVNEGFLELIRRLQPSAAEHAKVTKHKETVFSCLEKNFECFRMFQTGSYGNGTGVKHHSDTDYFAICPSKKLSDNSTTTLTKFREELEYTFWRTIGIRVSTPAVRIPFGNYASETMEIAPAVFNGLYDTPLGKKARYQIPDYDGGWMYSSPDAHNTYVAAVDAKHNGMVKPLIQLVKAWKFYNAAEIISFYLELRTAKYSDGETYINYPEDMCRMLEHLYSSNLASMQDPMKISGLVPASKTDLKKQTALAKLKADAERAAKAIKAERAGKIDDAFEWWDLIFNYKFPAR